MMVFSADGVHEPLASLPPSLHLFLAIVFRLNVGTIRTGHLLLRKIRTVVRGTAVRGTVAEMVSMKNQLTWDTFLVSGN